MTLRKFIRGIINESVVDDQIKNKIIYATDWSDFVEAVRLKYGNTIQLYHATTKENAEIIDREGLKLVQGKNFASFGQGNFLYFQLGKSSYRSTNRPVLYRVDAPVELLGYFEVDMDSASIDEETILKYFDDVDDFENMETDIRDLITYFIYYNFELEGMELILNDYSIENPETSLMMQKSI